MTMDASEINEMARLWALRAREPSFDDWGSFTEWLESDPAHLAAYETALEEDAWVGELYALAPRPAKALAPAKVLAPAKALATARKPAARPRWFAFGGAVAAVIAAMGSWAVLDRNGSVREISTAPGEQRTINLADGSTVILNGGSLIRFDPDTPRQIELARGEALFDVHHDDRDPFVVVAGGTRLVDVGTVFNVVRDGDAVDVAVAEGAVIFEPGEDEIELQAGEALSRVDDDSEPMLRKANPLEIGSWKSGQLHYDNAPLDQVARDLGRNIGHPIYAADGSERLRFTGTLVVDGPPDQILSRAGPLLGVEFAEQGDAWRMTPVHGSIR